MDGFKTSPIVVKELDDTLGSVVARIASLGVVDKDGDVTLPGAFGSQTVPLLIGHDWTREPVGKGVLSEVEGEALWNGRVNLWHTRGQDLYAALRFDMEMDPPVQEWSYGYTVEAASFPDEPSEAATAWLDANKGSDGARATRFLETVKVHEASPVLVGAGVGTGTLMVKAAIGRHKTSTSDGTWDAANVQAEGAAALRAVHAWVASDGDPEAKSSYKFPHHYRAGGPAVLAACSAGIGALNGARGGTVIPAGDRAGVYSHLAGHLTDSGAEPAELSADSPPPAKHSTSLTAHTDSMMRAFTEWSDRLRSLADLRAQDGRRVARSHRVALANLIAQAQSLDALLGEVPVTQIADELDELQRRLFLTDLIEGLTMADTQVALDRDLDRMEYREVVDYMREVQKEGSRLIEAAGNVTRLPAEDAKRVRDINATLGKIGVRRDELAALEAAAKGIDGMREFLEAPAAEQRPSFPGAESKAWTPPPSIGHTLTESKTWKDTMGRWGDSGLDVTIEVPTTDLLGKAVLTSTGMPTYPDRLAEPLSPATRQLQIADLMPQVPTTSNAVPYLEETTTTPGAIEVVEGAAKPEATLVFTDKTSAVRKIAVNLPVTEELLEDIPAARGYLDTRLRFFVQDREDTQLLSGNGTAPNLRGILNVVGIQTQAKDADPTMDAVFKAATKVWSVGNLPPDSFVVHPNDWQDIALTRTADGIYILGNPGQLPGPETGNLRLWGYRVVSTTGITEGTGLVGAFRLAAMIFRRTAATVRIFTETLAASNQVLMQAEERLALTVFRPTGFCTVTGI